MASLDPAAEQAWPRPLPAALSLAVLVVALLLPRKSCPRCGTQLPRFRKPANLNQAMLGGWTCPSCGAKIGRNGSVLPDDV